MSDPNSATAGTFDRNLLAILVCPVSRMAIELSRDGREIWCRGSRLAYPVRDGIPVMIAEQARELTAEELDRR